MPVSVSATVVRAFLVFWFCIGCLAPWNALADGKVFRTYDVAVDPVIPDQRALLHWMDGRETLVIETSVTGGGENLGWVVPLPAPPEVEAAPERLFESVSAAFSPRFEEVSARFLYGVAAALLLFVVRPPPCLASTGIGARATVFALTAPVVLFAAGLGGKRPEVVLFAFLLVPASLLVMVLGAKVPPLQRLLAGVWAVVLCVGLLLLGLSQGRLMGSGLKGAGSQGVAVLGVQNAGDFQATILRGDSGGALTAWLEANGYFLPPETLPAVEAYVRDGWVFAAMKVKRPADRAGKPLHPVVFHFASERPVYPMRLTATATAGRPLLLDLFVLGPQPAAVEGMTVRRLDKAKVLADAAPWEFRRWIGAAQTGTWLRGELPAASLVRDVLPQWVESPAVTPLVHTRRDAMLAALNRGAPLILSGGLLLLYFPQAGRRSRVAFGILVLAGMVLAGVHYARLEKVSVIELPRSKRSSLALRDLSQMHEAIAADLLEKMTASPEHAVRFDAAALVEEMGPQLYPVYTSDPGGSDPCFVIPDSDGGVESWLHDKNGARFLLIAWDRNGIPDGRVGRIPFHRILYPR